MSTKPDLRKELKKARRGLATEEHEAKSAAICQQLRQVVDWPNQRALHVFDPILALREVDIRPLLAELSEEFPGLEIYTTHLIHGDWQHVSYEDKALTSLDDFDVIIVPMLGFDDQLHRIGYGGGYYDKFLATQPNAQKIGVCFELGMIKELPFEEHDVDLDMIVTETGIYPGVA